MPDDRSIVFDVVSPAVAADPELREQLLDTWVRVTNAGRTLVEGLHALARELGTEHLVLSVRGGTGTERFYERFGYEQVGRHPDAIRLAPGADRDELLLFKRL